MFYVFLFGVLAIIVGFVFLGEFLLDFTAF